MSCYSATIKPNLIGLFLDKIFRLSFLLVADILLARHLGPVDFGIYSYVIAIYSIFLVISSFGIDNNLVRELVHSPDNKNQLISAGICIKFLGGLVAFTLAMVCIIYLNNDRLVYFLLISSGHLMQWTKVFEIFYQSKNNFTLTAWISSFMGALFFAIKITLIYQNVSLMFFCFVYVCEFASVGLVIMAFYIRNENFCWQLDWSKIKNLLRISWPLVLSGIAVSVYMKIDQIILQYFCGNEAVGIYSAAIKFSEGWYFLGGIITSVMAPHVYRLRSQDKDAYSNLLIKISAYLIFLAIMLIALILCTSEVLMDIFYGSSYSGASHILNVHIWALFFAFLGCVHGIYWIAEGRQKIFLYQNISSAILNILLNLYLVPKYQGVGAAWATLIAYGMPVLIVPYLTNAAKPLHQIHVGALRHLALIAGLKYLK